MKPSPKETTAGHTKTPWAINAIYTKGKITHWGISGVNETGDQFTSGRILDVRRFVPNHDGPTQEANAEFICLAVNHHAELVACLRDSLASLERLPDVDGAYRVTCIAQINSLLTRLNAK